MSTLQQGLVDTLTAALPGVRVIGYPGTLDGISGPTVMTWTTDLEYLPEAPIGHFRVTHTVLVYAAFQDPERAEADLSATLQAVLEALWDHPSYLLSSAQRTVSEDNKIHSWTLTVSAGINISEA